MNKMTFDFTNREVARLLRCVAAAYEVRHESQFRISAYKKAGDSVERATSEVKDLWDDNKLSTLAGIGVKIASYLDELFKTGKVKHFQQVMAGLPPAMFILLGVPGIGPKTAHTLCKQLGIKNPKTALKKLEKAAQEGRIRVLSGFGEISEKEILQGIGEFRRGEVKKDRMMAIFATFLAKEVINYLKQSSDLIRVDTLGSLRRRTATVGDIDIAVSTRNPKALIDHFVQYPKIKRILVKGEVLCNVILKNGREVNIRCQNPQAYGAILQHFTGSKHHNIALRELALKKGYSLSEYGIRAMKTLKHENIKTDKLLEFKKEKDFYQFLGLDWIAPELRENTGEIEAAEKHCLPKLVKLTDMKGDLHTHTNFSIETSHDEGSESFEQMLEIGTSLGYQYLGFSEHNPSVSNHSENQIIDLLKRKKEKIDQLKSSYEKNMKNKNNKLPVYPLNALEIDIKSNGKLAISDEGLALLDYAMVSIHSVFRLSREKMTQRVLGALSHPKVKILGHPTGRLLGKREGYELDWEKIFEFCAKENKFLEINASPDRLDLPDILVREAIKNGVKMVINTDSHQKESLSMMEYGVSVAKRGWATKKDIINTLPLPQFLARMGIKI